MDEEYARKKELMDWIVAGMAGRHYPKPSMSQSHTSHRMHNQESRYSPAFKPTGGYRYEPEEDEAEIQREATSEDYRKNPFLLNLMENEEREKQEEPPKQPDKPIRNSDWKLMPDRSYCNAKLGICRDIKGNYFPYRPK